MLTCVLFTSMETVSGLTLKGIVHQKMMEYSFKVRCISAQVSVRPSCQPGHSDLIRLISCLICMITQPQFIKLL